ncbi:hypothetical protein [Paraburkholderia sp.]|uniref:hypothetical protein n=1 Tax=Paraburkholderia sp. TaxID=1926495 RepID=UPI002D6651E3|nr:hypothetical protein [Paraburkholderia sp.]HZZ06871.1 hypothetical protein [Paraburkholderia sp.]
MQVVEGRLAALIEEILVRKQPDSASCAVRKVDGVPVVHIRACEAANDPFFVARRSAPIFAFGFRKVTVFFKGYVKNCAKSAQSALQIAKTLAVDKRRRAALAACFFAFFSAFPSDIHSANLSTTP